MKKMMMLIGAALFGAVQAWGATVEVSDWATLKSSLEAGNDVKLTADFDFPNTGSDNGAGVAAGTHTLDMNGHTITAQGSYRFFNLIYGSLKITGTGTFNGNGQTYISDGHFAYVPTGKTLTIDGDVTIKNMKTTTGRNGGAIYVAGGALVMNAGTIAGCTSQQQGGGVFVNAGSFTLNGGTITNCTATTSHGGGVYCSGTFTMNDGKISGCEAKSSCGGGVYMIGSSALLEMYDGEISGNYAKGTASGTGNGGGIFISSSATARVYGGKVSGNEASRYCGGIYLSTGSLTVYGGMITANKAGSDGGGIEAEPSATTTIYGGVVTGNTGKTYPCIYAEGANTTVHGGVFDRDPASIQNVSLGTGCVSSPIGSNYVVGKSVVSDANNQLTAGTYTFNPTNAEYVAAGVVDASKVAATGSGTSYTLKATGAVECSSWAQLKANLEAGNDVKLVSDFDFPNTGSDNGAVVAAGTHTLDMNGRTITAKGSYRFFLLNGNLKIIGTGTFNGNGQTFVSDGHFAYVPTGKTLTIDGDVTIKNMKTTTGKNGGAIYVAGGALVMNAGTIMGCTSQQYGGGVFVNAGSFTMSGGSITNCTSSGASSQGGAIYNNGTVTLDGGMISGCSTVNKGGAVYNDGTFTMNGGTISGCSAYYGGAIEITAGAVTINGGTISGNSATGGAAAIVNMDGGTVTIRGGVYTNNSSGRMLCNYSGTLYLNGGVFDFSPSTSAYTPSAIQWGDYSATQVGDKWVVGKSIAFDADKKLTAGTYMFCPTNAEYVAAGVVDKATTCVTGSGTAFNLTHATEELIVNGNFENRTPTTGYAGVDTASAQGWTFLVRAGIENDDSFIWAATHPGGAAAYIQSVTADTGSIQQSVTVTEAGDFAWSFDVAARPNYGNPLVTLTIGDQTLYSSFVSDTAWATVRGNCHLEPGTYVVKFTASWTDKTSGSHCASIDNVSLAKVCAVDCSTWAMVEANFMAGNDVKLANNVTVDKSQIGILGSRTLDMNGMTAFIPAGNRAFHLGENQQLTVTGNGTFTRDSSGGTFYYGGSVFALSSNSKLIFMNGTISNLAASGGGSGGDCSAISLRNTATFEMNGGTISGCTGSGTVGGAAVYVYAGASFIMNGGTITNCTASAASGCGGAVYSAGTFTMNGGTISGCKANDGAVVYVAANSTCNVYGGSFINNSVTGYGGAIFANSDVHIYGGYFSGNTATLGCRTFVGVNFNQYGKLHGGVFAADPMSADESHNSLVLQDSAVVTAVGSKYVVGKSVASDANNKLTAGTYTFNPTNAEYVAAGVAVKEGKFINAATAVTPKTWTISDYETKADPSSTYKPTQIVNGSFDKEPWMTYTYNGTTYKNCPWTGSGSGGTWDVSNKIFNPVDGGWNTTETKAWRYNLFEYVMEGHSTLDYNPTIPNTDGFVEMNCFHAALLYQDLTTYGGDVIRWSLKHGCRMATDADEVQTMRAEIGAPLRDAGGNIINATGIGNEIDPKMIAETKAIYRNTGVTDASGNPSTIGFAGSDIANLYLTKTKNGTGWWKASGVYVVPEGQSVSRFGFISEAAKPEAGNLLDDLTFSTLIGNLRALLNDDGSVTITGYWGDSDTSKKLMVKIGDGTADAIDMSGVLNKNFKITVAADKIGSANQLEVYHQDYESAKRTVKIGWAVTLNLNAADATCAKLTEYQRGAVTVLPIPTRRGYAFDGWFDNSGLTGDAVTLIPADATGAKEFWAKWESLIQIGDDAWAQVKNGVCTISGTGAATNGAPIDAQWASVKDVVIADGVTGLGTYFFHKFYNLTNVTIAASCTSLGEGALFRCLSLESVAFKGTSLPTLGENALPIRAAIKMEGGTPVVTMVPKVTVGGKEPTLKGSTNLTDWVSVEAGNEGDYHFFKYVIGD